MVVLSAAVLTKSGRTLFARQFVEMNRLRIEGLLAAFPKLLGTGNKQHTFIETDSVRYVYQPLEGLFLLLITNKASNIVEDLDTLRLLSKVVPEFAGGTSEEKVSDRAFELVFAFDEVITTGGYREYIDLRQIRQNLEMDSHEEKLHNMVKKTKIDSAKDQANHMSKVIKSRQREAAKVGGLVAPGMMAGIGGGDAPPEVVEETMPVVPEVREEEPPAPQVKVKGMKLGSKPKAASLMASMASEEGISLASVSTSKKKSEPVVPDVVSAPLAIAVEEKLSCQLTQEGALESFDLKGTLSVTATNDSAAAAKVKVSGTPPRGANVQTHPKVDKKQFTEDSTLALKTKFPVGRAVGVLRWSLQTSDESMVPLVINCWPEDEGDHVNVNIEYTLQRGELHNVEITLPCPAPPHIVSIDGAHSHAGDTLVWSLPMIDSSNASGTLEFNVNADTDAFFPISLTFESKSLYYDISAEADAQFSISKLLTVDNFNIQ
ncbi:hypothetical protein CTAYLR_003642 [Chrysophaeum taylorii]|uniref:Coatomer subunit delta n=1 Tax=Chrysophaeum taylorii TaxID=2483200 RepID=A0AAD7UDX2_9STRA|nr:hypothetical protein CTAYLR_003642 [Chrysophaeum taylorii]